MLDHPPKDSFLFIIEEMVFRKNWGDMTFSVPALLNGFWKTHPVGLKKLSRQELSIFIFKQASIYLFLIIMSLLYE